MPSSLIGKEMSHPCIVQKIIIIIKSFYSTSQKMQLNTLQTDESTKQDMMKVQNKIISTDGLMATGANSQEKNYLIILYYYKQYDKYLI